eukprot:CAMPEP_0185763764 /NCGR_PEP_ID=MMETSP1174-20130828/22670_1 /TAXON_ID=35687 /ORGANISM="Dictyocha speculum, Strain CCMP1381" /LENGTH=139 /DNA_ID=CAMNT_0028445999 /DNA_START=63 /DNA_END=482 /DNA_ORIENTATION=+
MNNPTHQDWSPVVLRKTGPSGGGGSKASGGRVQTQLRQGAGNRSAHSGPSNASRLEAETEVLSHDRVDKSLSKAIMQARLAKKMNQKALATAINEKPNIIQDYESGKAIPNPQILVKLDRALGCKLPRVKKSKKKAAAK